MTSFWSEVVQIVGEGKQSDFDFGFLEPSQVESFEAFVVFDVAKNRFNFPTLSSFDYSDFAFQ